MRLKNWLPYHSEGGGSPAVFGGKIRHEFMVVFEHVRLKEAILGWRS